MSDVRVETKPAGVIETDDGLRTHYREAWKVSEDVAMHFNSLLIGFRLKAIGGVAIGTAAVFGLKDEELWHPSVLLGLLMGVWVIVCAVDFFYYYRLLAGAVDELLRLERKLGDICLSHFIERRVCGGGDPRAIDESDLYAGDRSVSKYPSKVIWFYYVTPVLVLLACTFWFLISPENGNAAAQAASDPTIVTGVNSVGRPMTYDAAPALVTLDWLDQHSGSTMIVLTLVYVVATILIVSKQSKANRIAELSLQNAINLERQRNRPFMLVDIVSKDRCFYAVLKNFGPQPAIDVHVKIEPPIAKKGDGPFSQLCFVECPIPMMAPGREIEDFVGVTWQYLQEHECKSHTVELSYKGAAGEEYREVSALSFETYRNVLRIHTERAEDKIAKAAEEIKQSLRHIAECTWSTMWTLNNHFNRPSSDHSPVPDLTREELAYLRDVAEQRNEGKIYSGHLCAYSGEKTETCHKMIDSFLTCGLLRKERDYFLLTSVAYEVLRLNPPKELSADAVSTEFGAEDAAAYSATEHQQPDD